MPETKSHATLGTPIEQMLLRTLLEEKGFKVSPNVKTSIYYVNGVARIDIPDAFWMPPEEMRAMYDELKARAHSGKFSI